MQYQTRQGVFGQMAHGGGIFNNAISGLGSLGATMQTGIVPQTDVAALTQQCVSVSCKGLFEPDAVAACLQSCAAKAQAQAAAPKPSAGGGVAPAPPPVSPTAAQAAMYQPSGLSQKTIALAVGGVAAAAFVYLYMTKKKKG
jgi:hypothetical protein